MFESPIFRTKKEAELVVKMMRKILKVYGVVTIADLYDLSGMRDVEYTDNKYGWVKLRPIKVEKHVWNGWIIKLPPPLEIV